MPQRRDAPTDPAEAAQHYLDVGCAQGHTAHPMFDHVHLLKRYEGIIGPRNPLVAYLTDPRMAKASTQPLMAYRDYQRAHPEASKYSRGVTRHYLERGAQLSFEPTTWYRPDPDTEPEGLADWMRARRREWAYRRALASPPWVREAPVTGASNLPGPRRDHHDPGDCGPPDGCTAVRAGRDVDVGARPDHP